MKKTVGQQKQKLRIQINQIDKELRKLCNRKDDLEDQFTHLCIPERAKQIGRSYIYHNSNGEE
jgi:hypothetical protein